MKIKDAFVSGKEEITLNGNVFYVNEIGYLASQGIAIESTNKGLNGLALLVSESVTDPDGNKFTYEEVCRLKKEYAQPLFEAVVKVNGIGEEKN